MQSSGIKGPGIKGPGIKGPGIKGPGNYREVPAFRLDPLIFPLL